MDKKGKIIKWVIIVVLVAVVLFFLFMQGYRSASQKYEAVVEDMQSQIDELSDQTAAYTVATEEVNIDLIESEIKDIGELATIEYLYTDAGKFEDPYKIFGQDIPFTTKSFIAKWDGVIKAGVNVNDIITEVDNGTKEIIIHMPKAEILSHEIMEDSIETLDEQNNIFNPLKVDDVRNFDAISKENMEERAIENGILDKALENAEAIIEQLVNTGVVQDQGYTITFEVRE